MRRSFAILILFSCCCACARYAYVEKPDPLLTEDQMVDILLQSALIQAASTVGAFRDGRIPPPEDAKAFYAALYAKHGIDRQIFEQNNLYYVDNIKKYTRIYTRVSDSLSEILADAQNREKLLSDRSKAEELARELEKRIFLGEVSGPKTCKQHQKRDSIFSLLPPVALEEEFRSRSDSTAAPADTLAAPQDSLPKEPEPSSRLSPERK